MAAIFHSAPVFCEIFFKNISFSRPWGLLSNFLLAGDTQMIVSCHYSSSRVLQSQGIGKFGHYNQSENRPFFKSLLSKCANFPDVIKKNLQCYVTLHIFQTILFIHSNFLFFQKYKNFI